MATKEQRSGSRLVFADLKPGDSPPDVAVLTIDREGKVTRTAPVDADGRFDLPTEAIASAHRIAIGPSGREPVSDTRSAFARYRPAEFAALVKAGDVAIARPQWELWRIFTTCVSGHVRVCHRPPWWYDDLVVLADQPARRTIEAGTVFQRRPAARSVSELVAWPFRCSVLCNGRVEVYRRVCCCEPWIVDDPRIDDLIRELEDILVVGPIPPPGPDPGPGPDPAPFAGGRAAAFFREGALDDRAVFAERDLAALRRLPRHDLPGYVNARPYLRCRGYSCSAPVKVGEGEINPDGRFNICWLGTSRFLSPFCHAEYAYKVKQQFGLAWITVYNGPAANIWFGGDADADLVTYHPLAFGCRDNGEPGTGAFVYLDKIGDTSSHELETPASTAWDRVALPGSTSGLVFPNAASALDRHRNWGGTLKLNYMFSEDLRLVGARYYRISITAANAAGAPVGTRHYYDAGVSWTKAITTATGPEVVSVGLGPNPTPVGGENYLYEIPYDFDANWEANQFHAHLDTTDPRWSNPLIRHLVTIEIFDTTGKRLRPNGTPATGQSGGEITAAFTYERKNAETGPLDNVPFGALTHLFWWDNRPVVAEIVELVQDTLASTAECQFLVGAPGSDFSIRYRAYHEQGLFHRNHRISWKRGLAGASGDILNPGLGNVGKPIDPPGASPTTDFSVMLGPHTRCAFTVFLTILNKLTDGDDLGHRQATDSAAFALEIGT
jgi:hypothetical protein